MRRTITLWAIVLLAIAVSAQQAVRKKILSPEQQEYQRKWREYMANRPQLQARANKIFTAEMAREKAGECNAAATTYDVNLCLDKEATTTDENLTRYESLIRELMGSRPEMPGAPVTGPTGRELTAEESAAEFDRVEQAWHKYRDEACQAGRDQMGGGSAAPSSEMHCQIELARSHMRELDSIYWMQLHK